jgi:hypothetical protein
MAGAGWKRVKEAESGRWRWKRAMGACLDKKKQKAGNEELQRALGLAWAGVGRRGQAPGGRRRDSRQQTADEQTSRGRANGGSGWWVGFR